MEGSQAMLGMLSPRNLMKFVNAGMDYLGYQATPDTIPPVQTNDFNAYLSSFQTEMEVYQTNINSKQSQGTRVNLAAKLQIAKLQQIYQKVPKQFFGQVSDFKLQLSKRKEAKNLQSTYEQYLDEIQLIIFTRSGKYPSKSVEMVTDLSSLEQDVIKCIQLLRLFRVKFQPLLKLCNAFKRISILNQKRARIQSTKYMLTLMQKICSTKHLAEKSQVQSSQFSAQELIRGINRKQIQQCQPLLCLTHLISSIQIYRNEIKIQIFADFSKKIQQLLQLCLSYDKQTWLNTSIQLKSEDPVNASVLNITVLDQSYAVFEQPNQQNRDIVVDAAHMDHLLQDIRKVWALIKQFDIYEESEVSEMLMRQLIKHSNIFQTNMNQYVEYYAIMAKTNRFKKSQDKLQDIQMKVYAKIAKFYSELLIKLIAALCKIKDLEFVTDFLPSFTEFSIERVIHFLEIRKLPLDIAVQNIECWGAMIDIWATCQLEEIYDGLLMKRASIVQQHMNNIQKHLLINGLRGQIEKSSFVPISITSDMIMTIHHILNNQLQDLNQSISPELFHSKERTFRIIDKKIIIGNQQHRVCDSFLTFCKDIQRYLFYKTIFPQLEANIDERISQILGFYAWYNQKCLIGKKNTTLSKLCLFYQCLMLVRRLANILKLKCKKVDKMLGQITDCQTSLHGAISLATYQPIELLISSLYEIKITSKNPVPTNQSIGITKLLRQNLGILREYFTETDVERFLASSLKLLFKNYFGYLINLDKRGLQELKWLLPELRQIMLQLPPNEGYLFDAELTQMDKTLKQLK